MAGQDRKGRGRAGNGMAEARHGRVWNGMTGQRERKDRERHGRRNMALLRHGENMTWSATHT